MSHQEAPLGYEPVEAPEADLGRREQSSSQRRRHENSGRSRHHHSGNGSENNYSQTGSQRQRRHEGSEGAGRPRTSRRMPDEGDVEQQQVQRPIPRPAVSRYRRQGDTEARLRAQQQRQRQRERERQQREAERAEQQRMEDEEDDHSELARSASTESGFHNHTDQAEGDAVMALEAEPEDEGMYGVALRPEAEEYSENAESEQQPQYPPQPPPLPHEPLQNMERPTRHNTEALNPGYSNYVYTQPRPDDQPYSEPYADYGVQEHVYEEIAEAPEGDMPQQRRAGLRLMDRDSFGQQEAVGSRLHHYDERSDGESDSPEKEAEFAPYPRTDSCEQDEDVEHIEDEGNKSLSLQSLEHPAAEQEAVRHKEEEQDEEGKLRESVNEGGKGEDGKTLISSPSEESAQIRSSRQKRDAISLAIKDIKEAIEEVKSRTVRSPYTPDEPKEPIWVMRQDLSPSMESDLQPPLGGDSPGPASTSPQGAESSSSNLLQHEGSENFESPSPASKESRRSIASFPTYVEVPGPCDPEDLIDGIIFAANYLGSTQLLSDKTPSKNVRMMQAQEAVSRIKQAPEGETQPMTEVDLFISTQRIKVLNADSQETMMDHPLRTISYIADIGNIVVLMARRRMPRSDSQENMEASDPAQDEKRQYKMICHVFESEDAQLIAQSIGQAFSVAYQEFLRANGINPEDLSQKEYSDLLNTQDMYNDDLIHFSKSENCKDVYIEKQKGEILGVVIVESGWGSILPTVIIANMMHAGPAEKSGRLNIGDQIMSINGTSLVGLPLSTCQSIIKGLKNQSRIKLNIVRCPPVTTVLIRRPDLRYQLGFSVQNGIICSLMRGGIAERGGVRVGHRIIEINGQSVVATPHEKIVHILSNAVGEIHMKTMPAAMYRLLTAQEQPVYI
ncbi:amyloid-beta A4 precursor protein-binding family A member 1 isoform X3 [Tachysurus fulvidraco]|uniref:amyloid-beta A4 precursor protein-binding family A member 1 isoform X3 n=1 Tax=Tachysurus fulvidraco TaxID=1234273 RepID=UPI000F4D37E6|nr:amyloid-beta A4 precursor protein-binding family A member 1 isoform X3 [Tachysurus fulvidraco]